MAAGRTSKEIASELGISESTVNWHISNAFGRLGASSRAEAVALTIREDADRNNGNGTPHEGAGAPKSARRPSVPHLSIGVVALTLLLAVLGGALIAGWQVTLTPPSATAVPTGTPAPTVAPTARPSGALAPRPGTDVFQPGRSAEPTADAQATGMPAMPSPALPVPALESIAPLLAPAPVEAPTVPTALPSVPPLPTAPSLPMQLLGPLILPNPSLP